MKLIVSLVSAVAFALPVIAADDYELRMTRPEKVGDRFLRAGDYTEERTNVFNVDGKPAKADETKVKLQYEFESEILAVGANGRATSSRLKLLKITGEMNGKPLNQLAAGDEVVVTRKGPGPEGKEVVINKTPATKEQSILISGIAPVRSTGSTADDEVFGPNKRIKASDEWPVDAAKAVKQLEETGITGLKPENFKGTSKLVEVTNSGGLECLRVQGSYDFQGSGMPLPNVPPGVTISNLSGKFIANGDFPVDVNVNYLPAQHLSMDFDLVAGGKVKARDKEMTIEVKSSGKTVKVETSKPLK